MAFYSLALGVHVFSTVMIFVFLLISAVSLHEARYSDQAGQVILKLRRLSKSLMVANLFLVLLFLSGVDMALLTKVWNQGWIQVAGLMILMIGAGNGALVAARVRKILRVAKTTGDEKNALPTEILQQVHQHRLWFSLTILLGMVLGAVFIMSEKSSLEVSLGIGAVSIVGGWILGLATRGDR